MDAPGSREVGSWQLALLPLFKDKSYSLADLLEDLAGGASTNPLPVDLSAADVLPIEEVTKAVQRLMAVYESPRDVIVNLADIVPADADSGGASASSAGASGGDDASRGAGSSGIESGGLGVLSDVPQSAARLAEFNAGCDCAEVAPAAGGFAPCRCTDSNTHDTVNTCACIVERKQIFARFSVPWEEGPNYNADGTLHAGMQMLCESSGRLRVTGPVLVECGPRCACAAAMVAWAGTRVGQPPCRNRVTQFEPRVHLGVRLTAQSGLGVFANQDIPANTFICLYKGRYLRGAAVAELTPDILSYSLDLDTVTHFYTGMGAGKDARARKELEKEAHSELLSYDKEFSAAIESIRSVRRILTSIAESATWMAGGLGPQATDVLRLRVNVSKGFAHFENFDVVKLRAFLVVEKLPVELFMHEDVATSTSAVATMTPSKVDSVLAKLRPLFFGESLQKLITLVDAFEGDCLAAQMSRGFSRRDAAVREKARWFNTEARSVLPSKSERAKNLKKEVDAYIGHFTGYASGKVPGVDFESSDEEEEYSLWRKLTLSKFLAAQDPRISTPPSAANDSFVLKRPKLQNVTESWVEMLAGGGASAAGAARAQQCEQTLVFCDAEKGAPSFFLEPSSALDMLMSAPVYTEPPFALRSKMRARSGKPSRVADPLFSRLSVPPAAPPALAVPDLQAVGAAALPPPNLLATSHAGPGIGDVDEDAMSDTADAEATAAGAEAISPSSGGDSSAPPAAPQPGEKRKRKSVDAESTADDDDYDQHNDRYNLYRQFGRLATVTEAKNACKAHLKKIKDEKYTIDALYSSSSVAHLFNHSCDPNRCERVCHECAPEST